MPPFTEPTPTHGQATVGQAEERPAPARPAADDAIAPPGLARRARSWWATRWRLWVASLGVVATLTTIGVAALQQWIAWRTQDALVERALQQYAGYSARIFDDGLRRILADLPMHALAPVLGANAWSPTSDRVISADALARHLRTTPMWQNLRRDSLLAVAVIDYRPGRERRVTVRPVGSSADSASVVAVATRTRPSAEEWVELNTTGTTFREDARGIYDVLWAWQKDANDRPVALALIVTHAARRLGQGGRILYRYVPLVPPIVGDDTDGVHPDSIAETARAGAYNLRRIAIRLRTKDAGGQVYYASPNWHQPWVARSPFRGTAPSLEGVLVVEAVLNPDVRAFYPETRVSRAAQLMLGGVLALACMLALAAIAGLRRRQELAQTRELFVSSISHELRTPLTQIRLFSESLLNDRARTPEQGRRWMRVIDREARRLADLVDNALLYARSQRHDVQLASEPLDLHELVAAVVDATRPFAMARDASVEVALPPGARVRGDERALRHVLQNLVDNALKYGPTGQTVRIAARSTTAPTLDVSVSDEGPGVPSADRGRIWQPFVRLETDEGTGGTGLGLNVVHTLVHAARGRVWVEDAPGGGARFVVRVPLA
ncbi:MAG: sensor histidine kinase [Gemmatirosa sp.]